MLVWFAAPTGCRGSIIREEIPTYHPSKEAMKKICSVLPQTGLKVICGAR